MMNHASVHLICHHQELLHAVVAESGSYVALIPKDVVAK